MAFLGIPITIGTNFLQSLGWAVLNSLWQMAFLWVIFQAIVSSGVSRPSQKTRLATILLFTGFSWFLFTLFRHWFNPDAAKNSFIALESFRQTSAVSLNEALINALPWASLTYLFFLIVPVIQFFRNYRYVRTIRHEGLSKAGVDIRIFVQKFADYVGIRKPVHVYISELVTSPVTIGFLKPIILLPIAAISHLSAKQVEAILLHELAHIRRYDYFFNLLINFIRTVLYFNPFVKLFARTIEREREKSCDELVIQFQYDPYGYASALLVLEKNQTANRAMALAAAGQKNDLLHRVEKILGLEKSTGYDLRKIGGLLAGLVCIIGLNIVFILGKPVVTNNTIAFDRISNPFMLLYDGGTGSVAATEKQKIESPKTNNLPMELARTEATSEKHSLKVWKERAINVPPPPDFIPVATRQIVIPELMKEEEAQVTGAVAATKKILKEGQWKQVEKNVADALTQAEKETLKVKYYKEVEQMDWKKLENRLRVSYNNINWDNLSYQLSKGIENIRIDSLTTVFNLALTNLNTAESWMNQNQLYSIPDTDLKLQEIQLQKAKVEQQLKTLNAIKQRKIVHI